MSTESKFAMPDPDGVLKARVRATAEAMLRPVLDEDATIICNAAVHILMSAWRMADVPEDYAKAVVVEAVRLAQLRKGN